MKTKYRGSYTVEAALLMSVILLILFTVLRMDLFLTDQTRMTAVLAEDCSYTEEEEQDRNRWFSGISSGFFTLKAGRISRSAGGKRVTTSYPSESIGVGFGRSVDPAQSFAGTVRDPVKYMRRITAIRNGIS